MEDVLAEGVEVDEVLPVDHEARRQDPPRVAHVSQLVGSPVEAALNRLSLAEPQTELVPVE